MCFAADGVSPVVHPVRHVSGLGLRHVLRVMGKLPDAESAHARAGLPTSGTL